MADFVLWQSISDPFATRFDDSQGMLAFTIRDMGSNPNLIIRITREPQWSQQHPNIMGPSNSYLYFGPNNSPGQLMYGNGPVNHMHTALRQHREGSTSRYFTAQNTKHYKWRNSTTRMEVGYVLSHPQPTCPRLDQLDNPVPLIVHGRPNGYSDLGSEHEPVRPLLCPSHREGQRHRNHHRDRHITLAQPDGCCIRVVKGGFRVLDFWAGTFHFAFFYAIT
jgi:hypothetical protein